MVSGNIKEYKNGEMLMDMYMKGIKDNEKVRINEEMVD